MRKLITTDITSTSAFPIKSGTLDFLQLAYTEMNTGAVKAIINNLSAGGYDPTICYRLWGVVCTDDGGDNYSNTEGAVFYNGEFYYVPASAAPVFMDNGPYFEIYLTQYTTNADPVTFSHAVVHNVHNIYQLRLKNDNTLVPAPVDIYQVPAFTSTGIVFGSGWANVGSPNYNLAYKVEGNEVTLCGVIKNPSMAAAPQTLFTLPVAARPTATALVTTFINAGASIENNLLSILNNGDVTIITALSGDARVHLDNVKFRLY